MTKRLIFLLLCLVLTTAAMAQTNDYRIGSSTYGTQRSGGFYDYSEPQTVNIKVSIWGFVRFPGRYLIPINTTTQELISYAGGPNEDAQLEDIRLYRTMDTGESVLIKMDLNDLMWEETLKNTKKVDFQVKAGDILLIPGTQRLYFSNYLQLTLAVFSALISFGILLYNILTD